MSATALPHAEGATGCVLRWKRPPKWLVSVDVDVDAELDVDVLWPSEERGRLSACELEGRLRRKSFRLPEPERRSDSGCRGVVLIGEEGPFPTRVCGGGYWCGRGGTSEGVACEDGSTPGAALGMSGIAWVAPALGARRRGGVEWERGREYDLA